MNFDDNLIEKVEHEHHVENIQVAVRVRPLQKKEERCSIETMEIRTSRTPPSVCVGDKEHLYDKVFPEDTLQDFVYEDCVSSLVEECFDGRNVTILAYGQTGSGKTYTMGMGKQSGVNKSNHTGILPRIAHHLFDYKAEKESWARTQGFAIPEITFTVSFLELYQEKFFDLLNKSDASDREEAHVFVRDQRRRDGSVFVTVSGLKTKEVSTAEHIMAVLHHGTRERVTVKTAMNERSSRSHAVFTIMITHRRVIHHESGHAEIVTTSSKLNIVDLAGSERLKRSKATGMRAKEGININTGLFALGNVISALSRGSNTNAHIPYRSNKLTRLLQDSLGGGSKTLLIACMSPAIIDHLETANTLLFASRARKIQNKVVINQRKEEDSEMEYLRKQIGWMSLELMDLREKSLNDDEGEMHNLRQRLNSLEMENKLLSKELETYKKGMKSRACVIL
eukprot:m.16784 g.16784  ORF g.16784 m.16784 type:complete len:452 (-) comp4671_c2_seq1:1137-2492(-)